MNPELLDMPSGEMASEEAQPNLGELLRRPSKDFDEMAIDDLEIFEHQLTAALNREGIKVKSFAEFQETLPTLVKRKLKKPEGYREVLVKYLKSQAQTGRSRARIDAAQQADVERRFSSAHALMDEDDQAELGLAGGSVELREITQALAESDVVGEQRYATWTRGRTPVGPDGVPVDYAPPDQALVNKIDARIAAMSPSAREFRNLTDHLEVSFATALQRMNTFGSEDITIEPVTKYDDYAQGVDMIAQFSVPTASGQAERVTIGIDFTITNREEEQAKKLRRNFDEPVRRLGYGTRKLQSGTEFIPVVLTIDRLRATRLMRAHNFEDISTTTPVRQEMKKFYALAQAERHDGPIFQYVLVEELLAQLRYQQEVLTRQSAQSTALASYVAVIGHFERLLEQRKDLLDASREEAKDERTRHVYRLTDDRFIRSVHTGTAGSNVSTSPESAPVAA